MRLSTFALLVLCSFSVIGWSCSKSYSDLSESPPQEVVIQILDYEKWVERGFKLNEKVELVRLDTVTLFNPDDYTQTVTITETAVPARILRVR